MKLTPLLLAALTATLCIVQADEPSAPEPKIGEAAPAFRLNDHEGRATAIGGESETWTVVAFYPKALTPG